MSLIRLFFVLGLLTGCALVPEVPQGPGQSAGPLVTVETRGGLCGDGPCGVTTAIERDGRVHVVAPRAADLGILPDGLRVALAQAVGSADFNRLASRRFAGDCPTAFDGTEIIYTFATPNGPVRLGSCDVLIDPTDPLFRAVDSALGSVATGG